MKEFLLGFLMGSVLVWALNSYAYRMPKPTKITEINETTLVYLNDVLEQLWNITNGRYNFSTTTTAPNGNLEGKYGDAIIRNNSGTLELWINDGTGNNKVWQRIN